jgi:hypothetical protein
MLNELVRKLTTHNNISEMESELNAGLLIRSIQRGIAGATNNHDCTVPDRNPPGMSIRVKL